MTTKTLPLFTASLNTRAWAIRRSLASLYRCRVMEISWRECLRRASHAMVMAARDKAYAAAESAREAAAAAQQAAWAEWMRAGIAAGRGMACDHADRCAKIAAIHAAA